jgi:DNA mismatch repair protein MutS2
MNTLLIFPEKTLTKLELNKIFDLIIQNCVSSMGINLVRKIRPSTDFDSITTALRQVDEFKYLELFDDSFPVDFYHDLFEELNYIQISNSYLSEADYLKLLQFNRSVRSIFSYLNKRAEKYPELNLLLQEQAYQNIIVNTLEDVISDDGLIRKGVSPELDRIRKDIINTERQIENQFQKILHFASEQGWLESGGESFRNGRQVLSIHAEFKRRIKGILHDESATGKTVFLEPEATVELNNELFDLRQKEKREIIKILISLADELRPYISEIKFYQKLAGILDFIRAKALVAKLLGAVMPVIKQFPVIDLKNAVHPLLKLHNRQLNKDTIALNLSLNTDNRILVISGPNAGGKSVAIKTVGILQLMLQCGMLLPLTADSEMCIFTKMFVELGDQQSIENDLSTYSSHLKNMKQLCITADENTLFLIDEFGTGTDPKFGGAIAEAILEELVARKAIGVVNTHYSNLKMFASKTKHVLNGSMLFDTVTLNPLYVLKTGQPGSSYAFEIASKTGLPANIINNAKTKVDKHYQEFDALLATLETNKYLVDIQRKKLESDQKELNSLIKAYKSLKEDLEKNKSKILLENKQKALKSVEESNRNLENMLREIRQLHKDKESELKIRQEIRSKKVHLQNEISEIKKKSLPKPQSQPEIKVGSKVKLLEGEEVGYVEEIRKSKAVVAFNSLKTNVSLKDLIVLESKPVNAKPKVTTTKVPVQLMGEGFSPSLDVRGMRTEDALREVEIQLDKAMLLSYPSVRILHGKGNGILRKMIRQMLQKYDFIKAFGSETEEFGGEGITIVELK